MNLRKCAPLTPLSVSQILNTEKQLWRSELFSTKGLLLTFVADIDQKSVRFLKKAKFSSAQNICIWILDNTMLWATVSLAIIFLSFKHSTASSPVSHHKSLCANFRSTDLFEYPQDSTFLISAANFAENVPDETAKHRFFCSLLNVFLRPWQELLRRGTLLYKFDFLWVSVGFWWNFVDPRSLILAYLLSVLPAKACGFWKLERFLNPAICTTCWYSNTFWNHQQSNPTQKHDQCYCSAVLYPSLANCSTTSKNVFDSVAENWNTDWPIDLFLWNHNVFARCFTIFGHFFWIRETHVFMKSHSEHHLSQFAQGFNFFPRIGELEVHDL